MKDYHLIQQQILKKLLFSESEKFSKLKPFNMEGSQFTFHLDKLIKENLVSKNLNGEYSLTTEGKNIANRIDSDSKTPQMQAKHSAVFACKKDTEFLIYKRLKNPFYGCQGFPTGKVQYGESIYEAAKKELKEETNLEGEPELIGIRHYTVYTNPNEKLVEDKVMYIFLILNPKGELISNEEGEFQRINTSKISEIVTNPLEEFFEILELIQNFKGEISFKEVKHFTNKF